MPIMRHDTNKEKFFQKIVDYCCSEKIENKGSFILLRQQVVYKYYQNFSLAWLRNKMSFENVILHRRLFLYDASSQINRNLERVSLNSKYLGRLSQKLFAPRKTVEIFYVNFHEDSFSRVERNKISSL